MSKNYRIGNAFETDGTRNGEPIYCPVNAYGDCPYCDHCNVCHIANPLEDCDDFGWFWDSWEEYDNCDSYNDIPDDVDECGFNPFEGAYDYDC